jgi:hypothetical protein
MNSTTDADGGTRLSFPRIAHPVHASALSPSSPKRTEPQKVPKFFGSIHGTMLPAFAGARILQEDARIPLDTGSRASVAAGYCPGTALMIAAALVEWRWGVAAERRSLERVCRPLPFVD